MRRITAYILALALTLGGFTACSSTGSAVPSDPFASQFEFPGVTSETAASATAVVSSTGETEPFKGYRMINVYLNGNLLAVRYYDTVGNMTREKYMGDDGYMADFEYDADGNLIKDTKRDTEGVMLTCHVYEYDDAGNNIKKTFVNDDGSLGVSHIYGFDGSGFLVLDTETGPDGSVTQVVGYENDIYGNPTSQILKDHEGNIYEVRHEYEYDADGNITMDTLYRGGELNGWTENEYDQDGNLITEKDIAPDGSVRSWIAYDYLDDGSVNSRTNYKADGTIFQIIMYGYDQNGLVIETKYDSTGEIVEMYQYTYTY